jgi:hypothetical protein
MHGMTRILAVVLITACSRTPAPSQPSQAGERERGMLNCPSAVATATTEVIPTDMGVDLVITAPSSDAQAEIVARAERQVRMGDPSGLPEHSGMHGGPGTIGYCPVIHDATSVKMSQRPGGVTIQVRALVPDRVKALQEETQARVTRLQQQASR